VPPNAVDLTTRARDRSRRRELLLRLVRAFAADLVHAHLLEREDLVRLAGAGVPLVVTVHNTRPGWPPGLADLQHGEADLLIACAAAVEKELRCAGIVVPMRTIWNSVNFTPLAPGPGRAEVRRAWRQGLAVGADDLLLLALANPRPQKRLERLPAVLAATQAELDRKGMAREARLLLVGEATNGNELARQCVEEVRAEIARRRLESQVRWTGPVDDVPGLLAASDVLVSTSAYEGLSLAQVEAVAAGLGVVATDVGGVRELAHQNPAVRLLAAEAGPEEYARAIVELTRDPPVAGREAALPHFHSTRFADRHAWLYPQVIAGKRGRPGTGLWLITNNFSMGGAQSSARRLLLGLQAEGVAVRAATLQDHPEHPTFGRRALIASGVPVLSVPPPERVEPAEAVARILERLASDPPRAVVLWNVIPEHKMLLAEGLLDIPLFDVSPGEMYFSSLERYFSHPCPGLPYRSPADYGARLAGVIVKYHREREQSALLGAPVHVIPNGVPLPSEPWRPPAGRDRLILGTLVRISPQKKLGDLLAALQLVSERLPPHVLRIAGGVEQGAEQHAIELRRLAEELAVEWLGGLDEPAAFLRELDLFVLVAEPAGCPNASLEALALGLPVIVTDVGGTAEQVVDGIGGRLVPRGDTPALAGALLALAGDPEQRARLGAAGREHVARHFGLGRMVADYRRVCLDEG
jgi:glycosyltransferase involved in cell wall biosynthesis